MDNIRAAIETMKLDLRGLECPFVLGEIVRALHDRPDPALEVLCDHPTSVHDTVPAFCRSHGYDLAAERVGGSVFRMRISRSSPSIEAEGRRQPDG